MKKEWKKFPPFNSLQYGILILLREIVKLSENTQKPITYSIKYENKLLCICHVCCGRLAILKDCVIAVCFFYSFSICIYIYINSLETVLIHKKRFAKGVCCWSFYYNKIACLFYVLEAENFMFCWMQIKLFRCFIYFLPPEFVTNRMSFKEGNCNWKLGT